LKASLRVGQQQALPQSVQLCVVARHGKRRRDVAVESAISGALRFLFLINSTFLSTLRNSGTGQGACAGRRRASSTRTHAVRPCEELSHVRASESKYCSEQPVHGARHGQCPRLKGRRRGERRGSHAQHERLDCGRLQASRSCRPPGASDQSAQRFDSAGGGLAVPLSGKLASGARAVTKPTAPHEKPRNTVSKSGAPPTWSCWGPDVFLAWPLGLRQWEC
jgi:hypothetical protein